jgi:hypothetical protein
MSTKFGSGRTRRVYEFIRTHRHRYDVRRSRASKHDS